MTTTKIVFFVLLIVASLVMTANANPFKKAAADQCIPYTSRAGQLCDTTTRCVPGYVCVDGTCKVLKYYSGRSCESTSQCLSIATYANAYCFEGKCVFTGRYEGDFCLDDTQCRSRRCTKNKCTAIPVGSACNPGQPTEFCTMGAICLQQNCTRLNGLGESCLVPGDNTISGKDCISPYVCDTKQNKCVKPVTALGASCSPDIANQCSPSTSRYCRKVATDVYQCAQYQRVEQACDSVNDVQCEKGLSCDSSQQKCVVPYKICTSTASNECASNEKCFCRSASAGGYCGTFAQRNCARDYTLFNSCLAANCNPYITPVNTDGETVIIIADRSSCIHRKCSATFLQYYNCMKKDLADRSISIPSIQGYNSAPVAQSLQMMTVLVALLMYYLL